MNTRMIRKLRHLAIIGVLLLLLTLPAVASAHSLDQYLQSTYLTVAPDQIEVEIDLSPGVLVAPAALLTLDTDGDGQITAAEGDAYGNMVLQNLVLQVDGQAETLVLDKVELPSYITIQAGYGTIRVFAVATLPSTLSGDHEISFVNNYAPTGSTYQVNAFVDKGIAVTLGKQNRSATQQSMIMPFAVGTSAATTTTATAATDSSVSAQTQQLAAYLDDNAQSPWVFLLGLLTAALLGGLHALTPGHGKTLAAAYLVGSRGTVRHAVALGGIVTFTHTASVIVIGLLALFASQFVVPNVLVPLLEVVSGGLVVAMGTRLIWARWRGLQSGATDHAHDSSHPHEHGPHTHTHEVPASGVKMGGLVAMGVSGGLVPCPEALGIMVIAVGLNRALLGLGLIVSFSVGLAVVLIGIGILLVRSRSLVERFGGLSGRWSRALPLASAVIVTLLGLGITYGGLMTYIVKS